MNKQWISGLALTVFLSACGARSAPPMGHTFAPMPQTNSEIAPLPKGIRQPVIMATPIRSYANPFQPVSGIPSWVGSGSLRNGVIPTAPPALVLGGFTGNTGMPVAYSTPMPETTPYPSPETTAIPAPAVTPPPLADSDFFYFSYDDSASTAGVALSKEVLKLQQLPDPSLLRPWEFLNAAHFEHEAQVSLGLFKVSMGIWKYSTITRKSTAC